ncbi:hypothetical protein AGMMS49944_03850 [Spirochaetia bacterium]|nr:hypothetical protein AGMMS49944_03850 [Spirochaetia bacterium]
MKYEGTITYEGIDFEVTGDYCPEYPARMYTRNGDPGEPGGGGELEDLDIMLGGVSLYDVLAQSAIDTITEKAEEAAAVECENA